MKNTTFEKAKVTEYISSGELKEKWHKSINQLIDTDVSKWSGYACKPSCFINSKESEYYPANKAIADYECEHIVKTQLADGSWEIPWQWENYHALGIIHSDIPFRPSFSPGNIDSPLLHAQNCC